MSYAFASTNSNAEYLDDSQQSSGNSSYKNYGPDRLAGQGDYPSPSPSMSPTASPSAYSYAEHQIESSIGPSVPNRIMTRGKRKTAMNVAVAQSTSRSQTPQSSLGYPLTPDSMPSSSVPPIARQSSASPALSSISSQSPHTQKSIQQQQYQMSPTSPAVSHTVYGFHLPGPQLSGSQLPPPLPSSSVVPRAYPKPRQRKQRLFNIDRKAICQYHLAHPHERQEVIARQYGVERSTISKILKHKEKWLNLELDDSPGYGTSGAGLPYRLAKHRPSKFPPVEFEMQKWLVEVCDKYYASLPDPSTYPYDAQNLPSSHGPLSDASLREKARAIARSHGITQEQFKASSGWVENFKHRHGIRNGFWGGYLRNVQGRNELAASDMGLFTNPVPPPLATASKMSSKPYQHFDAGLRENHEEEEESDSEEEDDDARVEGLTFRPTLSHLRDSSFSRPPWSTGSPSTSASSESRLKSHHQQGHHHAYSPRSSDSHSSTPTEPLSHSYRQPSEHRDVSAPGSPYAHSQPLLEHAHSQSSYDHDRFHHEEVQMQFSTPGQTRYNYTANVDQRSSDLRLTADEDLPEFSARRRQSQGAQTKSMLMETSRVHASSAEYEREMHIQSDVQMQNVLETPIPPPPPVSDTSMPTLAECEDYLTKISLFVDKGGGQGILTSRRREWLRKLKVAFFEAGSGIPITPDSDEEGT